MGDGEMALELKEDQTWAFYDMSKGSLGSFVLDKVSGGTYQPVYEAGRPAILTDNRYLYYPSQGRDQLEFMQRFFKRVGNTRDDLPYLSFPDEPKGTVATR